MKHHIGLPTKIDMASPNIVASIVAEMITKPLSYRNRVFDFVKLGGAYNTSYNINNNDRKTLDSESSK